MKAFIVINLHDDLDLESVRADVLIRHQDKKIYRKHQRIYPLEFSGTTTIAVDKWKESEEDAG